MLYANTTKHGNTVRIVKLFTVEELPGFDTAFLSQPDPEWFLVEDTVTVGQIRVGTSFVDAPLELSDFQIAHDSYLNTAARAKNYDSIHTAALRAGYPGPFHIEGVLFATWMDECNVAGYAILAEIQTGTRPMFNSVEEYIALLPVCPVV